MSLNQESIVFWLQAHETALALSAAAAKPGGGWASDVRSGVYLILGSRIGQQQRHAALRLAAAVLELVHTDWLLDPVPTVSACNLPANTKTSCEEHCVNVMFIRLFHARIPWVEMYVNRLSESPTNAK